jgi:hypothetical protein
MGLKVVDLCLWVHESLGVTMGTAATACRREYNEGVCGSRNTEPCVCLNVGIDGRRKKREDFMLRAAPLFQAPT